ncbi:MAG: DUF4258 domain-containing protein [bacterium]|nr:DUF4258 domain-containing protein [bacterium]
MPRHLIDKIRDAIRNGNYDMSLHAVEEMGDDNLRIVDVESAVLNGKIVEQQKDEQRSTKYVVRGLCSLRSTSVGVVGRFKETGVFLIITVYAIK